MRVETMRIQNLLNHTDTEIEFGGITVIAGGNNQGKSGVKDALEMLLTGGAMRVTDKAGHGAHVLIRTGADCLRVSGTVTAPAIEPDTPPTVLEITRTKGKAGNSGGHQLDISTTESGPWRGSIPDKQKALYRAIGAGVGVIRACIHAGRLVRMDPKEQQELLFPMLGLSFTLEDVERLLQGAGATPDDMQHLRFGGRMKRDFLGAYPLEDTARTFGPEIFDEGNTYVVDKRRQAKRDLRSAQGALETKEKHQNELVRATPELAAMDQDSPVNMRAQLDALEVKRDKLSEAKGSSVVRNTEGLVPAALESDIRELEKLLVKREEWDAACKELGVEVEHITGQIKVCERAVSDADIDRRGLGAEIKQYERQIESFAGDAPECPICGDPCPLDEDARKAVVKKLKSRLTTRKKKLAALKNDGGIPETLASLIELRDSKPGELTTDELAEAIGTKRAQLAELAEVPDTSEIDAELEPLKERIRAGHAKIRLVESYLSAVEQTNEAQVTQRQRAADVEAWERLVKAFGPVGAKLAAVGEPLAKLSEQINERLSDYAKGYEVLLDTSGEFRVRVRTPETDGGWVSIKAISDSERLRIGVALQDAICHLSGLGFLVIDSFDMLLPENRTALGQALRGWAKDYEMIVIIVARQEKPAPNDSRTTYWIEHGSAELVQ